MRGARGRKLSFSCSAVCGEGRGRTWVTHGWRNPLLHLFGPTKCLRKLPFWSTAGAERRGCLVQENTCLVCRFMNIYPLRRSGNVDFLGRVFMFQRWLYRNVAEFGFPAYHSAIKAPILSCSLRKLHVFFFPADFFFIFHFSMSWLVFCCRSIRPVVMMTSCSQVLIWGESENKTYLPAAV